MKIIRSTQQSSKTRQRSLASFLIAIAGTSFLFLGCAETTPRETTPPAKTEPGETTPPPANTLPKENTEPATRDPNQDPAINPEGAIRESK